MWGVSVVRIQWCYALVVCSGGIFWCGLFVVVQWYCRWYVLVVLFVCGYVSVVVFRRTRRLTSIVQFDGGMGWGFVVVLFTRCYLVGGIQPAVFGWWYVVGGLVVCCDCLW